MSMDLIMKSPNYRYLKDEMDERKSRSSAGVDGDIGLTLGQQVAAAAGEHAKERASKVICRKKFLIRISSILVFIILSAFSRLIDEVSSEKQQHQSVPVKDENQQIFSQQARAVSLVSGPRQKRPLSIDEEDAFIMRTLASAASSSLAHKPVETSSESIKPVEESHVATTTTTSVQGDNDEATTLSPEQRNPESSEHSLASENEDDDGRIAIDKNRKIFETHDQLVNASTKDEAINSMNSQQSSRAGMGRLAYASSFLSDLLFRPRIQQVQPSKTLAPSTTSSPIFTQTVPIKNFEPDSSHIEDINNQEQQNCPGVCLNILSASIRCQKPIITANNNGACPIFHKCCLLDLASVSSSAGSAHAVGYSQLQQQALASSSASAFNRTPVETSAPLASTVSDADQTNPASSIEGPAQDSEKQQAQATISATTTTTIGNQSISNLHGSQVQANRSTARNSNESGSQSSTNKQQAAPVYFLSSASDTEKYPNLESSTSAKPADLLGNGLKNNQQHFASSTAANPDSSSASAAASSAVQSFSQPTHGQHQQHSAGSASTSKQAASQSFDTSLSSAVSLKPSERVVALQLGNGSTAFLIQDSATTSRPRPIYANWTDYQLLMQMHQAANRQQQQPLQPIVYHSNVDPVRKLNNQDPRIVSTSATSKINNEQTHITDSKFHQVNSNKKSPSDKSPQNESFDLNSTTLTMLTQNESNLDSIRVLKDQHSPSLFSQTSTTSSPSTTQTISASHQSTSSSTSSPSSETLHTSGLADLQATTEAASTMATALNESDMNNSQQQEDHQQSSDQTLSPIGAGIASLLGTLIDSFIPSSSSTESGSTGDSSLVSQQQPDSSQIDPMATSADGASPSFFSGSTVEQPPQNDRRFGLDLSFRQQNEQTNLSDNLTSPIMLTDHGSPPNLSSEGTNRCLGYCALDQFLHLCDSYYVASDCSRSQKCCLSSAAGTENNIQSAAGKPYVNQVCRGTCLPIYHSSLCTKPNELIMTATNGLGGDASNLISGACLPNQVCCSPPALNDDSQANQDGSTQTNMIESANVADQQHYAMSTSGNGAVETASNELAASLVPPPPPTLIASNQQQQQDQQQDQLMRQVQSYSSNVIPRHQQQLSTRQTVRTTPAPSSPDRGQAGGVGIVNQILSMFKSANNNGAKQRIKANQQQAISGPIPELMAPPFMSTGNAVAPMYELQPTRAQQQLLASPSMPRPQLVPATAPQVVFAARPQASPVTQTSRARPSQMIAPNGQPFSSNPIFEQHYVTPASISQQRWNANSNNYVSAGQQQPAAATSTANQRPNSASDQMILQQHQQQIQAVFQKQLQQYASMMATAQSQQQQPTRLTQFPLANSQFEHPFASSELHQPIMINYNGDQQKQQRPIVYQQLPQSTEQQTRWTNNVAQQQQQQLDKNNAQQVANRQQQMITKQNNGNQFSATNSNSLNVFNAADASSFTKAASAPSPGRPKPNLGHQQQAAALSNGENAIGKPLGWQQVTGGSSTALMFGEGQHQNKLANQQQRQQAEASDTNIVAPGGLSRPSQAQQQLNTSHSTTGKQEQQQSLSSNLSPTIAGNLNEMTSTSSQRRWQAPQSSISTSSTSTTTTTTSAPIFVDISASDEGELSMSGSNLPVSSEQHNTDHQQPVKSACPYTCMAPLLSFNCAPPHYIDSSFVCPNSGAICCVKNSKPAGDQTASSISIDTDLSEEDGDDESDTYASPVAVPDYTSTTTSTPVQASQQSNKNTKVMTCGVPGSSLASEDGRARRITSGAARGRVMGGTDAEPGHWCWQAALMNGKNEYLCGGALIGAKWVLTAAHCVTQHLRSESQLYVRLGQWNLNSSSLDERRNARSILVKTSYVHHNHNGITLDNDIALLRLESSALEMSSNSDQSSSSICTVCLPERSNESTGSASGQQLEPGRRCTVTGYGYERESGPAALRVRQTDLPIVSDSECQNKTSLVLDKPFVLPASSFCAGGELGQDACHGDGGSPLSCKHSDGYYELTGIVSWGYKCGQRDLPGLYAKVSNFVGWINQIVSVNN